MTMSVLTPQPGAMQIEPDDLRDLMRLVNETSQRLHATHVNLQSEVSRLQRELAEANAALRRSQALAALGEMAAGIAHEVRNPLGSIQLYVQMLAEDVSDRPEQAELCAKISRSVTGLDAVVRDVLNFARDLKIRPQCVSPQELFARALDACAPLLREGIEVTCDSNPIAGFEADANLMTQALANVVRNAAEAMIEARSPVRLLRLTAVRRQICCPSGRHELRVVLAVRDSGPGIPPQVRERIFNPFFTTRATGTGLGLAIVHRIVDAHGGHIAIENPAEGGALFEVCLPLQPPTQILNPGSAGNLLPRQYDQLPKSLEHGA